MEEKKFNKNKINFIQHPVGSNKFKYCVWFWIDQYYVVHRMVCDEEQTRCPGLSKKHQRRITRKDVCLLSFHIPFQSQNHTQLNIIKIK